MARPSNPEIRTQLRERAIDYVLQHGFAAVSLRPMAKELKTNARMLVYHFGSREGLMREILTGLRERENVVIHRWFQKKKTPPSLTEFVLWYWKRLSVPAARTAALLIFELYALALRDPKSYPGVLDRPACVLAWAGRQHESTHEDRRGSDTAPGCYAGTAARCDRDGRPRPCEQGRSLACGLYEQKARAGSTISPPALA